MTTIPQRLYINIDHVATIRQARRGDEPVPVDAVSVCERAGADGITAHLREDRRHMLDAGGASGPDPDGLQRVARALRGSATMAKLLSFAEVAAGVERVGRALREGALHWDAGLSGVVVAAVDDCKLLLRNVRTWSDAEDTRARARVSELTQYAAVRSPTPLASPSVLGHDLSLI